jgi:hypothetical protein
MLKMLIYREDVFDLHEEAVTSQCYRPYSSLPDLLVYRRSCLKIKPIIPALPDRRKKYNKEV